MAPIGHLVCITSQGTASLPFLALALAALMTILLHWSSYQTIRHSNHTHIHTTTSHTIKYPYSGVQKDDGQHIMLV